MTHVTPNEISVLINIAEHKFQPDESFSGPVCTDYLADGPMHILPASIPNTIASLSKKGLVDCEDIAKYGSQACVILTPAGIETYKTIKAEMK